MPMTKTALTQQLITDSNALHDEFWKVWTALRAKMPGKSKTELAAADHAAWIMFKSLRKPARSVRAEDKDMSQT